MTQDTHAAGRKYRFTVEEYHRMGEVGIIPSDRRVELINGEIIEMSPIKSLHAGTVKLLNTVLGNFFKDQVILGVQDPVELNEYSEPEPDLSVLKFRQDYYTTSHPKVEDVLFLVEVADSSLDNDRRSKLSLYAEAGVSEVWIINLPDRQIEVYTKPTDEGYAQINIFRKGDQIRTASVDTLDVDDILL